MIDFRKILFFLCFFTSQVQLAAALLHSESSTAHVRSLESKSPVPKDSIRNIGAGTHGKISVCSMFSGECTKEISADSSPGIEHEVSLQIEASRIVEEYEGIKVPHLIKYKKEGSQHYIVMQRIPALKNNKLLHLSWNYPPEHQSEDSQGIYWGIDYFTKQMKFTEQMRDLSLLKDISYRLGFFYGILHQSNFDAYDMEFVLARDEEERFIVWGYDFDKCSIIPEKDLSLNPSQPVVIRRKTGEASVIEVKKRSTIFATSISYFPCKRALYNIFFRGYKDARSSSTQEADQVLSKHQNFNDSILVD